MPHNMLEEFFRQKYQLIYDMVSEPYHNLQTSHHFKRMEELL